MKRFKLFAILGLLLGSGTIYAQNVGFNGFCEKGATTAVVSGLPSTNTLQGIVPGGNAGCLVQVYLTGTTTPATIFSTITGGTLANPFRAANSGQWLFFAASSQGYDVVMSGGLPPNAYTTPVTLTDLQFGGGGGGGGGCGPISGDTSSTNCGTGNFTNYSGTAPANNQAYGFDNMTNIGGSSQRGFNVAIGNNSVVGATGGNTGGEIVGIGDFAANSFSVATTHDLVAIGDSPADNVNLSSTVCIGDTPCTPKDQTGANTLTRNTVVAIGADALGNSTGNTAMNNVIAIGDTAASSLNATSGTNHDLVVMGNGAASDYTGAVNNVVAFGNGAGSYNGSSSGTFAPSDLVAIGDGAGTQNGGNVVVAIGISSGSSFASGSTEIVGIGDGSATGSITGSGPLTFPVVHDVVGIGDGSALRNAGNEVIAIGNWTLSQSNCGSGFTGNTGSENTGMGDHALPANTSGSHNVAIGYFSGGQGWTSCNPGGIGNSNTTGSQNTWIGDNTGPTTTTQVSNTIALGYNAGVSVSNSTVIGNSSMTSLTIWGTGNGCLSSTAGVITGSGSACGSGGGGGSSVEVNGGGTLATVNLSNTTPAAGANGINVSWQNSGINVSAEIVGDGNANHFLNGTGTFTSASGITLQTNSVNNTSQATLNLVNSSTNAAGLTLTQTNTSGGVVQGEIAGTLNIAHGGTGQATASTAFNALSPMTTLGDIIYGGTSGAGTRLAGSTSATAAFLIQTGTGTVSAAPVWTLATALPAITTSGLTLSGVTGSTQCLQANTSGVVSGTGSACGSGSGTTFQVNGTGLASSSTVNFQNSAAFNGLTATFSNPSAGNVQLGFTGTLGNGGLTNSSVTYNGVAVALGASGTIPLTNGTVTYTSSQVGSAADNGKLVIMNCTAACSYTLPATQPSTLWMVGLTSQGTTLATVVLGGSDTFNGVTSAPALNSFRVISVWANTATSTDYRGDAPLVAGTNMTFTPASNGLTLTASSTGSVAFSAITGSTNTTAAMVVGTGASLATSGSGTIAATSLTALSGLPAQAANTVVGNATAGSASPTALPMTSCTGGTNAVTWTNGTGFGCQSIAVGVTSFSGDGNFATNSSSTGAVTLTLHTATAHTFWGNNTASTAAPAYDLIGTSDVSPNMYAAGAGTANAQTVTLSPAATALTGGLTVRWLPSNANTGAATLAANGLTATSLTKCGSTALVANDLLTTVVATATYDGTRYQLLNPQAGGCASAPSVLNALTMNNSGSGASSGATFNGSAAVTLSYNTLGAAPLASPTFTGTVTIPALTLSGVTGSTQCLQANTSGVVSGTGSACGSGGGVAWNAITNPTGNLALTMGSDTSTWTFGATTGSADLMKITDTASNTGTGIMMHITTASSSTEIPWQADANGVGCQITTTGALACGIGSGVAGTIDLTQGTAPGAAPSTTLQIYVPTSVTAYNLVLPGAAPTSGNTMLNCTAASPSVCSWTAGLGDTITSPNSTITIGGTATATTIDVTGAAGKILAGATPALTFTPTLGVSGTAGTLSMFPASGNFTTTWGSAATASNTILGFATAPTTGDLVDCTTSSTTCTLTDSGVLAANVVTAASAATAAKQTCVSSGSSKTCSYIDFPEHLIIPAANCNNATGGAGWSIGSGGTVTCRAGTNNLGGYIAITDTSTTFAQFYIQLPEDWDTGTLPYIRFQFAYPGTDGASAHTIIPQIKVSCLKGDGSTSDDVTFAAAHSSSTVTLSSATANLYFDTSNVQLNSTDMTGCVAGSGMIIQVGRATDTATSAVNFYSATVTIPRLVTVQAN